jgi:archaellum component FlaG (FlaF/FlaG flagellin family)
MWYIELNMKSSQILLYLIVVLVLSSVAAALYTSYKHVPVSMGQPSVVDFATCEAAGDQIMETSPRQCRTADGRVFTEELTTYIITSDATSSLAATTTHPTASSSMPLPTNIKLMQ